MTLSATKPLKSELISSLSPLLAQDDFKFNPKNDRFIRIRGDISDSFLLVSRDGKPGIRIQPSVGIRFEQVEKIFHKTSGFESKYQNDTPTMGNSVGEYLNKSGRSCEFLIVTSDQVTDISDIILEIFRGFAIPYYERWGNLVAIDAEINGNPEINSPHRPLPWYRCTTGLIVARLVGRSNYGELVAAYANIMTQNNKGFYLSRFQALVKSLESIAHGSGQK
jgi:hypothetical protein